MVYPAEKRKRAEEGQQAAPASGPRADSNGGPAVSLLHLTDYLFLAKIFVKMIIYLFSVTDLVTWTSCMASHKNYELISFNALVNVAFYHSTLLCVSVFLLMKYGKLANIRNSILLPASLKK